MKSLIQVWLNVAYRSVGREVNLLKRLVDLEGFALGPRREST